MKTVRLHPPLDRGRGGPRKGNHVAAVRALARVDKRTVEGAAATALRAALLDDSGDHPSAARLALVDCASFAGLMVARLSLPLARGEPVTPEASAELRSWNRELRQCLGMLGLTRIAATEPTLHEILRRIAAERNGATVAAAEPAEVLPPATVERSRS